MKRISIVLVSLLIVAILFFIGSIAYYIINRTVGIVRQIATPPNTFLYTSPTEAWYITWINRDGNLTGISRDVMQVKATYIWIDETLTIDGNITGHIEGSAILLNINLPYDSFPATGTFDSHTLILNIPASIKNDHPTRIEGQILTFLFKPSDTQSFNHAVYVLNSGPGSPNDTCMMGYQDYDMRVVITGPDAKQDCSYSPANSFIIESDIPSFDSIACSGTVKQDKVVVYDSGMMYYGGQICKDIFPST